MWPVVGDQCSMLNVPWANGWKSSKIQLLFNWVRFKNLSRSHKTNRRTNGWTREQNKRRSPSILPSLKQFMFYPHQWVLAFHSIEFDQEFKMIFRTVTSELHPSTQTHFRCSMNSLIVIPNMIWNQGFLNEWSFRFLIHF